MHAPSARVVQGRRRLKLTAAAVLLAAAAGCDQTLETGYTPRKLGATEADRRSYYAPPFSPAAHADKDSPGTGFSFAP